MICNDAESPENYQLYCYDGVCSNMSKVPYNILHCSNIYRKNMSLLTCNCVTYNKEKDYVEVGFCVFNVGSIILPGFQDHAYLPLPMNINELNEVICGESYKRSGTLCGECKDDHYPLVYSFDMQCVKCPNGKSNWWKFVLAAFLPLTVFYLFILIFKLNVTSSHFYGIVWYSQLVLTPKFARMYIIALRYRPAFQTGVRLMGMVYGIWNLDFFRSFNLGICLETDSLSTLALDLAISIYPLLLIILTYIFVEVYDNGFCVFGFLWKTLKRNFIDYLHSGWEIKTSLIDAFSTLFLLSNVKFLNITFDLLVPVVVYHFNSTSSGYSIKLYYDATIPYFGERHLPYGILAIIVLFLFVLLPVFLLILYPFHWFQKLLNLCPIRWHILHIFMDSFLGCYKDGTEPATRDCRWVASIFFLVPLLAVVFGALSPTSLFLLFSSTSCTLLTILLVVIQPFKCSYTNINTMFVLLLALFYTTLINVASNTAHLAFLLASAFSVLFPLLYTLIISLQWLYARKDLCIHLIMEKL